MVAQNKLAKIVCQKIIWIAVFFSVENWNNLVRFFSCYVARLKMAKWTMKIPADRFSTIILEVTFLRIFNAERKKMHYFYDFSKTTGIYFQVKPKKINHEKEILKKYTHALTT